MTENDTPNGGASPSGSSSQAPAPVVTQGRGMSLVWVIPIVALVVGAFVAFDAFQNRGVKLVINLPNAEWIEAGKTKIQYLAVEIGIVDDVVLKQDRSGVELHCTVDKHAKRALVEGTEFWLVHPQVGAAGISGLGTLLSGAYFAMSLGPIGAKNKHVFDGLESPPLKSGAPGALTIRLHSEELNSLGAGSPVYYRKVQVGKVEEFELEKDGGGIALRLYFPPEHASLVREDSRFWSAGGIAVSGSLADLDIEIESLESILSGGIAFDSPRGLKTNPAKTDSHFWLHPSRTDTLTYPFRYGGLKIYVETPQLGSVSTDAKVYYREIPVGAVISHELLSDSRHVRVGLNIQSRYATLVRGNSVFWNASGITANLGLHGLQIHTESLASILAGGIAFATPDSPAHPVKAGSVFQLHPEVKDEWLAWSPLIWRGPPGEAPAAAAPKSKSRGKRASARFFHHKNKNQEESERASEPKKDPSQEGAREEKRHGFFSGLFKHHSD